MNVFDYMVVALLATAGLRGYRQGFSREFFRMVRMGIVLVAGTRGYQFFQVVMERWSEAAASATGPAVFGVVAAATWFALRSFRKRTEEKAQTFIPVRWQAIGGALAAAVKTGFVIGGIITVFNLAAWLPGHDTVIKESWTGNLLAQPDVDAD